MVNEKEKDYYVKKKRFLIRQFDAATSIAKSILSKFYIREQNLYVYKYVYKYYISRKNEKH